MWTISPLRYYVFQRLPAKDFRNICPIGYGANWTCWANIDWPDEISQNKYLESEQFVKWEKIQFLSKQCFVNRVFVSHENLQIIHFLTAETGQVGICDLSDIC